MENFKNVRIPKTRKEIHEHPAVEEFYKDHDGYWVWLKDEYRDLYFDPYVPFRELHEQTVKDMCARFGGVFKTK